VSFVLQIATSVIGYIKSFTFNNKRFPSLPPGWYNAKLSSLKFFTVDRTVEIASPITRATVVLEVGARFKLHASLSIVESRIISEFLASVESIFPVIDIIFEPISLITGNILRISSDSPLLPRIITTSSFATTPRSPCKPSAGCKNTDNVPVEERVAAILFAIIPDFPIPVITNFPEQLIISFIASKKFLLRLFFTLIRESISIWKTSFARLKIVFSSKFIILFFKSILYFLWYILVEAIDQLQVLS